MEFEHADRTQGALPEEFKPYFQGQARFQRFTSPFGDEPAVFVVHFDAGGRTRPHVHRSGQVLYVADGEGIVATEFDRRTVRPGDVVTVNPDEWHWHGGTPTWPMSHFTVQRMTAGDAVWDVDEKDWASGYE
jgi:quercetin dioxygenase-like cupin family protein